MTDLDVLRYPIGRFHRANAVEPGLRAAQIQVVRELPERLRAAVSGLSDAQLDTPYREAGWTVRQVVHHLADSHAMAYIRCRLALTEDWPTITPYKEAAWANLPDSRTLPVDVSLAIIEPLHIRWTTLFDAMSDEEYQKGYTHPERGRETLAGALAIYEWHCRHHTAHITSLRTRQGW